MASLFSQTLRARPLLTSSAILAAAGGTYYYTSNPRIRLDSAQNEPTKTFAFPRSMLFAKTLTVTNVEEINHDTKRITFALPGGSSEVSGVPASSAILTQHTPSGSWFPVFRPYTPTHDREQPGVLQLMVKKYPNGRASTHMHSLAPGSTLTVRGPLPGYTWTPSSTARDVLLIAGGAGITPLYSLTKGILSDASDKSRVYLLWGVNGTRDIVLKQELERLQTEHPDRLHVTYCVSGAEGKPEAPSLGDEAKYKKGYVDRTAVQEVVQSFKSGQWGDDKGTKVFLCGPPAMEEALAGKQGVLADLGVEKKKVHRF